MRPAQTGGGRAAQFRLIPLHGFKGRPGASKQGLVPQLRAGKPPCCWTDAAAPCRAPLQLPGWPREPPAAHTHRHCHTLPLPHFTLLSPSPRPPARCRGAYKLCQTFPKRAFFSGDLGRTLLVSWQGAVLAGSCRQHRQAANGAADRPSHASASQRRRQQGPGRLAPGGLCCAAPPALALPWPRRRGPRRPGLAPQLLPGAPPASPPPHMRAPPCAGIPCIIAGAGL